MSFAKLKCHPKFSIQAKHLHDVVTAEHAALTSGTTEYINLTPPESPSILSDGNIGSKTVEKQKWRKRKKLTIDTMSDFSDNLGKNTSSSKNLIYNHTAYHNAGMVTKIGCQKRQHASVNDLDKADKTSSTYKPDFQSSVLTTKPGVEDNFRRVDERRCHTTNFGDFQLSKLRTVRAVYLSFQHVAVNSNQSLWNVSDGVRLSALCHDLLQSKPATYDKVADRVAVQVASGIEAYCEDRTGEGERMVTAVDLCLKSPHSTLSTTDIGRTASTFEWIVYSNAKLRRGQHFAGVSRSKQVQAAVSLPPLTISCCDDWSKSKMFDTTNAIVSENWLDNQLRQSDQTAQLPPGLHLDKNHTWSFSPSSGYGLAPNRIYFQEDEKVSSLTAFCDTIDPYLFRNGSVGLLQFFPLIYDTFAALLTSKHEVNIFTAIDTDISCKNTCAKLTDTVDKMTRSQTVGQRIGRPVPRTIRSKTPPGPLSTANGCTYHLVSGVPNIGTRIVDVSVLKRRSMSVGSSSARIIYRTVSRARLEVTTTILCCETTTILPASQRLCCAARAPSAIDKSTSLAGKLGGTLRANIDIASEMPVSVMCNRANSIEIGCVQNASKAFIQKFAPNSREVHSIHYTGPNKFFIDLFNPVSSEEQISATNANLNSMCYTKFSSTRSFANLSTFDKADDVDVHDVTVLENLAASNVSLSVQSEVIDPTHSAHGDQHGGCPEYFGATSNVFCSSTNMIKDQLQSGLTLSALNSYILLETVDLAITPKHSKHAFNGRGMSSEKTDVYATALGSDYNCCNNDATEVVCEMGAWSSQNLPKRASRYEKKCFERVFSGENTFSDQNIGEKQVSVSTNPTAYLQQTAQAAEICMIFNGMTATSEPVTRMLFEFLASVTNGFDVKESTICLCTLNSQSPPNKLVAMCDADAGLSQLFGVDEPIGLTNSVCLKKKNHFDGICCGTGDFEAHCIGVNSCAAAGTVRQFSDILDGSIENNDKINENSCTEAFSLIKAAKIIATSAIGLELMVSEKPMKSFDKSDLVIYTNTSLMPDFGVSKLLALQVEEITPAYQLDADDANEMPLGDNDAVSDNVVLHEYGEMFTIIRNVPQFVEVLRTLIARRNADPQVGRLLARFPSLRPGSWNWIRPPSVADIRRRNKYNGGAATVQPPVVDARLYSVEPTIEKFTCVLIS